MITCNFVLGTAAVALMTTLVGSASATADNDDASRNARYDAANEATYPTTTAARMAEPSSESAQAALPPVEPPAVLRSPEEPIYAPEAGDAEYGSKLNPERSAPPGSITAPPRFNDATGQ